MSMKTNKTEIIMTQILFRIEKFSKMLDEGKIAEVQEGLRILSEDIYKYGYQN